MADSPGAEPAESEVVALQRVVDLLGGTKIIRRRLRSAIDVHDVLRHGLPRATVTHLYQHIGAFRNPTWLENAIGMDIRTFQRHKRTPTRTLSQAQSGRTWTFAKILAQATEVFGSRDEALQWLERPAIGLEQRRPIDLLATPAGVKIVEDFLARLEYGVYA